MRAEHEYDFMKDYTELQRLKANPEAQPETPRRAVFSLRERIMFGAIWAGVTLMFVVVAVVF
jgi:hypothetical protein